MIILQADSIGKAYRTKRVLNAATIALTRGQITALLGRVGEGKTTLLKIFGGLEKPDSGWVSFNGVKTDHPALPLLARGGLFYLADRRNLVDGMSLAKHFRELEWSYGKRDSGAVIELLQLSQHVRRTPRELAGGERRRAELACAMLRRPSCLLADEPFRDLDPITASIVGEGFRRMASDGCAIALTGHEVRTLTVFVDSVVWLTAGTTYQLGSPANAWTDARFQREYLGPLASGSEIPTHMLRN